jgi:hypothetical protein
VDAENVCPEVSRSKMKDGEYYVMRNSITAGSMVYTRTFIIL